MSVHKRPYTFDQQFASISNQTHKDIDVLIWANPPEGTKIPEYIREHPKTIYSEDNFGVWERFKIAQHCESKYICIIDDDTIPGYQWVENCINTINKYDGVITTRGVLANYGKDHMYPHPSSYQAFGWGNPNEEVKQVDMGCHCWFFEKSILFEFWKNAPRKLPKNFGEDMHISYIAQKLGLGTYIPPHPINNLEMWGSNPSTGNKYGTDENAISWNNEANKGMNEYWNHLRSLGFKILAEQ
jgi:hypothetical protein